MATITSDKWIAVTRKIETPDTIYLADGWTLSTEHSQSSYGHPVLIDPSGEIVDDPKKFAGGPTHGIAWMYVAEVSYGTFEDLPTHDQQVATGPAIAGSGDCDILPDFLCGDSKAMTDDDQAFLSAAIAERVRRTAMCRKWLADHRAD